MASLEESILVSLQRIREKKPDSALGMFVFPLHRMGTVALLVPEDIQVVEDGPVLLMCRPRLAPE